jgi:sec-independent protein translocase protein TatB
MFGIGTGELLLLLVIALIVLGPERMPKVARDLGRMVGDLRRTSDELREEFMNADKLIEAAAKQSLPSGSGAEPPAAGVSSPAATGGVAGGSPPASEEETAFDREMREARERIKTQQSS